MYLVYDRGSEVAALSTRKDAVAYLARLNRENPRSFAWVKASRLTPAGEVPVILTAEEASEVGIKD